MPGDKGVSKDKTFTKLHQAVWNEDIDTVKKFVKIEQTSSENNDNKFGSGGKKRLKLSASTFATGNFVNQILSTCNFKKHINSLNL